jgi:capsid assembly protease
MRNLAVMAARLSGRPLLMRDEASVLSLARIAGVEPDRERRSGLSVLFGRARKAAADLGGDELAEPLAWLPDWMGEADAVGYGWSMRNGVAVIRVDGPLLDEGFGYGDCWWHGYDTLRMSIETAREAGARAIAIRSNSPGGMCAPGLPELGDYIRSIRAAAGGVPIWGIVEGGYSAMYWLLSACDVIVCMKQGGAGSIGAVVSHCDVSGAMSKEGIVLQHIQFGAHKTDFSSFKPLSDDAKARLQAEIDQWGRWFVAAVAEGRPNLTPEAIIATQARCYFGDSDDPQLSALKVGLVDRVMTEREAFAALEELVATPVSPAAPAASAPLKEKTMKRSTLAAVLDDPKTTAAQKVAQLNAIRADEGEEDPVEGAEGEDDEEDTAGEPAPEAEGGEGDEEQVDAKVAKSILDSPEAKGRDNLARELAFTPGMTLEKAEKLLKASGKTGGLADRMEGRDPQVTHGGGRAAKTGPVLDSGAIFAKRRETRKR